MQKAQEEYPHMMQFYQCPITYIIDFLTKQYSVSLKFVVEGKDIIVSYADNKQRIFVCDSKQKIDLRIFEKK